MLDNRRTFSRSDKPQGRIFVEVTELWKSLSEKSLDPTSIDEFASVFRANGRIYQRRGVPETDEVSLMQMVDNENSIAPQNAKIIIGRNVNLAHGILADNCCSIMFDLSVGETLPLIAIHLTDAFWVEAERAFLMPTPKLTFELAVTQSLQVYESHKVIFDHNVNEDGISNGKFTLLNSEQPSLWFAKAWFRRVERC